MQLTKKEVSMVKRKRSQRRRREKLSREKAELEIPELRIIFYLLRKKGEREYSWKCKVEMSNVV